ncbi:MAG TPA: chemotaxis protein CheA [Gemmatimonadaceae bacterium]|nr:chemotaxis protein CheA [Gemmatimonadaceae bacterium]
MDLAKYAALFQSESREQLSTMNEELLALERTPTASEPVSAVFRAVHTMKGMSATMGYATVTALAHELESLLDRVRHAELVVDREVTDTLFAAVDALERAVEIEVAGGSAEEAAAPALARLRDLAASRAHAEPPLPLETQEFAIPSATQEFAIPAATQEFAIPTSTQEFAIPSSTQEFAVPNAARSSASRGPRTIRVELRRLDGLTNLAGELLVARGRLTDVAHEIAHPALDHALAQTSRLIADLHDQIMASRMVPVGQVFDRFPRLVRDAAKSLGKEIELALEGREIELDRSMLDEIGEPIVHLLRNAADHGIEQPDVRERAGKPRAGQLTLTVTRERQMVTMRVEDDGRGINRDRVLERARAEGLVDATVETLSDEELVRIIARPGFSTAASVTDLSGRGVGIDVVLTRVRALGGSVQIASEPGAGTRVTLRLPVTLAIVRALLARVDGEMYAVPMTHVRETVELRQGARRRVQGREMMLLRDEVVPLLQFREIVGLPEASLVSVDGSTQVIVIECDGRRTGLVVDEFAGEQDIVVKGFDSVRDGLALFSGATILADGAPALIVDVSSLN